MKPYYKDNWITIYNMNCIEGMKQLENKSIDLVLTDPPYNLDMRKQPIVLHGRKVMYSDLINKAKWDIVDIQKLYNDIFPSFDRIVKNNGSIIIFVRTEWLTYCIESAMDNNFDIKATITWHKTNPIPQVRKKNYLSATESILWFARWKKEKCPFTLNFRTQKEMHNYIEMPLCGGKERTAHPTQKPLKLIKYFLLNHSNAGDTVLDGFLGSGTTTVACKDHNRFCIAFETKKEYCDMAVERVRQDKLF